MFDDIVLLPVEAEDQFATITDFNEQYNPEVAKYPYKKI